jgi:signal transduction histidine kinase
MNAPTVDQELKNKVDKLNLQAWQLRVSDSIRAKQLSNEAIDLAETINYIKGKAEGYRTFGFTHIRLSKHEEALVHLQKAFSLFEELHDLRGLSTVYEYLGIIQRNLGNLSASLEHLFKGLELARQVAYREEESLALYHLGVTYKYLGNYEQALECLLQSLAIARSDNYWVSESYSINLIGQIYFETGDYISALDYYNQSLGLRRKSGDKWGEAGCLDNIGFTHFKLDAYSDAQRFCSESLSICELIGDKKGQGNALLHLGLIAQQLNNFEGAIDFGNKSLCIRKEIGDKKGEAEILLFLAKLHLELHSPDEGCEKSFELLHHAMRLGQDTQAAELVAQIHFSYYEIYRQVNNFRDALTHLEAYNDLSKQIHTDGVNRKIHNLEIGYKVEKSRQEAEIYRLRNIELAALFEESKRQKEEIEIQNRNVEQALVELKATQAQLIQSEKMASLGELTAGIAHEIQNPLNFVNNFSEVSKELLAEMKDELEAGNTADAIEIAADVIQNLEKVLHHGKRADSIVKGMLQHSRSSSGQKEATDINQLADEYLRLAYHGLRAKDKSFNATMKTDFDETIETIKVVPQDIGRVMLNLITNAFHTVVEKKKQQPDGYEPTVSVSTKKLDGIVEIKVADNGNGIPQKVWDKIFQPFFTTKPAGEGTGLGLSLSYDIVKAHGGELKVETKEGEGTEFKIILSVNP